MDLYCVSETVGLGKSGSIASIISTGHMKSAHLVRHTTCARIVNLKTTCKHVIVHWKLWMPS